MRLPQKADEKERVLKALERLGRNADYELVLKPMLFDRQKHDNDRTARRMDPRLKEFGWLQGESQAIDDLQKMISGAGDTLTSLQRH